MSRNLLQSSCCGNILRLVDLRGQAIQFRRYTKEPVVIGCKWTCPTCHTNYFARWQDVVWTGGYDEETPKFAIDLSYYETFNDECARSPVEDPWYLCLDDALDNQNVL